MEEAKREVIVLHTKVQADYKVEIIVRNAKYGKFTLLFIGFLGYSKLFIRV